MTYIRSQSRTGYDRRYEDKVFAPDTRCIEMVDYVGTGDKPFGEDEGPANYFGVYYCRSESFYRTFANATFGGPCIVDIGEFPAEAYDESGEAITDTRINMAAAFRHSDLEILPHGCSRYLIDNMNNMFEGCRKLRNWTPQEMEASGLANVRDPAAPRILKSNGIAESAFLYNLAPETMRYAFAGCLSYSGKALNAISWARLKSEKAAEGFAEGCRFEPYRLDAIISWIHREALVLKRVRTPLLNVDLGAGRVTGEVAKQARELIEFGIQLTGFEIN
jgi:hypothetical protein